MQMYEKTYQTILMTIGLGALLVLSCAKKDDASVGPVGDKPTEVPSEEHADQSPEAGSCAADPKGCHPDTVAPFILGETVPSSQGRKVNIGSKDEINGSGQVVEKGATEIKTIYGSDRQLTWQHLDDIRNQSFDVTMQRPDIILQAFNMSYDYIYQQLDEIAAAGYTIIQLSPPQETLNKFGIWWEAYQPTDHRVFSNRFGTERELRRLIARAHDLDLKVIADTVLNHMADPLRVNPNNPLVYSDLYGPRDFINYDLYQDLLKYKFQVLDSPVDQFSFFYQEGRSLFERFHSFLATRGLDATTVLSDRDRQMSYETLFVRQELPWLYKDLERLLAYQDLAIKVEDDELLCRRDQPWQACSEHESFLAVWESFFGAGALIVRGYYFELVANKHPIYENEWDNPEKVLIKWYPGLPSLNTDSAYVKKTHLDLLYKMLRIGFDGFRLDAVKHIPDTYFAELLEALRLRLQQEYLVVDGALVAEKPLYMYGEMATSKVEIANQYRRRMDLTDFFLLDTFMYASVFPESFDAYGRGEENLQLLRKSRLLQSLSEGDNQGWQKMLYPASVGSEAAWFSLNSFDRDIYLNQLKDPIYFARIHDSVVGDMFILKNYQQAMLGYAYMLSATGGKVLVYGSDQDVLFNAGADYKEKVVLSAIKFRQATYGLPYTDRFENFDYCGASCDRKDLLFIDRGDLGLAVIYSGSETLSLERFSAPHLRSGCYLELMSGRQFQIDEQKVLQSSRGEPLALAPRSAAFILPARCAPEQS